MEQKCQQFRRSCGNWTTRKLIYSIQILRFCCTIISCTICYQKQGDLNDDKDWSCGKNYIVLDAPTTSLLQCRIGEKCYSYTNHRRGAVAEEGLPDQIYDVCIGLKDMGKFDNSFLLLLREKVLNMNIVYESMLAKLEIDGYITKKTI